MSCFPSFEPLSDSPDTNRYERALQAAAGGLNGSESCGPWSLDDAAAFWLPGWRPAFDAASRSGLLRPSRAIDAGPLALLITRLACWRTSLPYIAVRDGEQHFKFLSCPYWVHDAVTNLAHLVPRLLVDPETQLLIRSAVASSAVVHLRQLHGQLSHDRWNKKWGRTVRGVRKIVAVTVDSIWRLNVRPLQSTSPYGQPRGT